MSVGATLDPAPGNAPLSIPGTVDIGEDAGKDVDLYTVTVTVAFTADGRGADPAEGAGHIPRLPVA